MPTLCSHLQNKNMFSCCGARMKSLMKQTCSRVGPVQKRFCYAENQDLGHSIRCGIMDNVNPETLDGCSVCIGIIGPNNIVLNPVSFNRNKWVFDWIRLHDGYNEKHLGTGAVGLYNTEYNLRPTVGKRCGRFCCQGSLTEDLQ